MRRLRIHQRCPIVLATLLVVSAARAGRADDTGAAEYGMGMWLVGKGRMVEAEAALRRGLAIDEAGARGSSAASRRARAVSTLDVLASLAAGRGDSREAETLLRRALVLGETAPRLPDVEVARILTSLARLLAERGDLREAEARASRAWKLYERMKGPEHVELAEALRTLAAVRASRGNLDGAEALLLRARRVAELENARPAVRAAAVANVGALRMLQGRYQDAEPILKEGLDLGERALGGPDHPALIRLKQTLADCYQFRGRPAEAETLYQSALRSADRAYGPRHPAGLPSLSGLAVLEERRGNDARAESLHREALGIAEDSLGPNDPARGELLANLAAFYARQGDDGTAEHLFVRALAALEHIEARDPRRVAVLQGLASLYATQGRRDDAARIESALAAVRAMFSPRFTVPPVEEP
jgi:tetratricopeptide (TPR) repeat protein